MPRASDFAHAVLRPSLHSVGFAALSATLQDQ
jgi:hypothetical protein